MQMIESVNFFTSHDANKYLGTLFRLRRKEQKISELELSKLLGISQQQVSRYENGLTNFSIIMLFKLFHTLNMNSKEVEGIFNELKGFYSDSLLGGL